MNRPIGVFDSGLGGLTVVKAFLRHLPDEPIVYFGDTARVPYGTKSKETITRFSGEIIRFLKKHDVKMVVIACHTASALALDAVIAEFPGLPILGVVDPASRKAVETSRSKRIGVIGTRSTVSSGSFERALYGLEPDARVFSQACPLFVPLVEEGWVSGGSADRDVVEKVIHKYIDPLAKENVDSLILGCTHYPILADRIREALPAGVVLVDPAEETALSAKFVLKELGLAAAPETVGTEGAGASGSAKLRCFVSDDAISFKRLGEAFLGRPIPYVERVLDEEFQTA